MTLAVNPPTGTPDGARGFGPATVTFVIVSSMIGTGVLTTSGYTMALVGSNQLMLALWLVGGLVALCGALSVAELSTALPEPGGDFVYLREAFGPLAGFLSGWVSFLIGFGAPIAAAAFASAKYLLAPLHLEGQTAELPQLVVATIAILAFSAVHVSGRSHTVRAQGVATGVKLAILGSVAAAGLFAGWGRWANLQDRPPLQPSLAVTMVFSLVYISYAYTGWNAASYLAGEVKNPQRWLPRAILGGTALVVTLYLALNLAYAFALSASDIQAIVHAPGNRQGLDAVAPIAQLAAERLYGPRVAAPLSVAIGFTLLTWVSAYVLTGPRVAFAMARAGLFPAVAGRLSRGTGTPAVATGLQVAWSLVLLWTGSFEGILLFAGVGLSLFSMLTVSSVYVLRLRRPDLPRPFRTPGYPFTPAVFLIATAILTAAVFYERPAVSCSALATILAGVPIYFLCIRARGNVAMGPDSPMTTSLAPVLHPHTATKAPASAPIGA